MANVQPLVRSDLTTINCASCAMEFAVPSRYDVDRRRDHATFYCPTGHPNVYSGKSAEEKRIAELENTLREERRLKEVHQRQREWAEQGREQARRDALTQRQQRGKAEAKTRRLTARIHVGVCPHCNRTFEQLARHMATKHSECVKTGKG